MMWAYQTSTSIELEMCDAEWTGIIEEHYQRGGKRGIALVLMPTGWLYRFDFDAMTQFNVCTKTVRDIRRIVAAATQRRADKRATWSWCNNDGTYEPFGEKASARLELEYQRAAFITNGSTCAFKLDGVTDYEFNFNAMHQKNLSTATSRPIVRDPNDVEIASRIHQNFLAANRPKLGVRRPRE